MVDESNGKHSLLKRIRNRTEAEQSTSPASMLPPPYRAAALGQAPYVAVGNGVIIVQRKCHNNWNC
jgi:hypothetical protein